MSNYPDNIRDFDHHPQSPFYEAPPCEGCGECEEDCTCECEELGCGDCAEDSRGVCPTCQNLAKYCNCHE